MTSFEPIAIVGQACILPGASSPDQLWRAVERGRDMTSRVSDEAWRVDPQLVLTDDPAQVDDHTWTDRGGYVRGFAELFDPAGFGIDARELVETFDPLVHWLLHSGREALTQAGLDPRQLRRGNGPRCGAVMGNLSYPSPSLSQLAEAVWLDRQGDGFLDGQSRQLAGIDYPHAQNRYNSGLPVQLMARALGLRAGAFALDAACSSSLYAIKLACDRLHDRKADLMLAGGVNRADDLFIHIGFCALQAMSRSGRSRPFHREADGLLPAEGAAVVLLRRLEDAVAAGDQIFGVIRAVGLSNDGRGRGLLAPCAEGQERALRRAYRMCALEPKDVSLVECHATGTSVGDVVEVRSMARVFSDHPDLPIASLKSNMGHLITASGAAGLIKVCQAMEAGVRPPSLHADPGLPELDQTPLRVLNAAEPWECNGPRIAAVNNFGFGGNNAHLLVEQWELRKRARRDRPTTLIPDDPAPMPHEPVAIVGLQALASNGEQLSDFNHVLFSGDTALSRGTDDQLEGRAETVPLPLTGLRFPPNDLDETLAQQLMLLRAALLLSDQLGSLPRDRTGVLVGMQCDAEVGRYGARLRIPQWARDWAESLGFELDKGWIERARAGISGLRHAAGVVGAMPNIPANRLSSQFDLAGPSFTVSAEELSGVVALELARRALKTRELDAAVVGAVDLCCEPVQRFVAEQTLAEDRHLPGDAAVVLVLKRLEDARQSGDPILAVLPDPDNPAPPALTLDIDGECGLSLTPQFGHAHAASGLLHVAAGALACFHRASPGGPGKPPIPWWPADHARGVSVQLSALGGASTTVTLQEPRIDEQGPLAEALVVDDLPTMRRFAAADRAELLARLLADEQGDQGPARLAVVARDEEQRRARLDRARELLEHGHQGKPDVYWEGIHLADGPVGGETAFVFTGPAGVYPGMGRHLLLALPGLLEGVYSRCQKVERTGAWIYDPAGRGDDPHEKLWGSSFLSQLHAEFSRTVLGLTPQATLGFCSGETNALFAMDAWRDMDAFYPDIVQLGVFSKEISGSFDMVRRSWQAQGLLNDDDTPSWVNWRILASRAEVQRAVDDEPCCHLTIVATEDDVVIGGDEQACKRVVDRVGKGRAYPLGYDVAIHCPEMEAFAGPWRTLHHRTTYPVPGVRFYSSSTCSHYNPTADAAASALLGMALRQVNFPRVVRRAYDDGVRVFVEHGPRDGCTKWIESILGPQREFVAVPLDRGGRCSLNQAVDATARLWVAGVAVDCHGLETALHHGATIHRRASVLDGAPLRSYPAHPEPVILPPLSARPAVETEPTTQTMAPAPVLPSVLAAVSADRRSVADAAPFAMPTAKVALPVEPPRASTAPAKDTVQTLLRDPHPAGQWGAWLAGQQQRLTELHRQFVQQQADVHDQFLALRAQSHMFLAQKAPHLPATTPPVTPSDLPSPSTSAPLPAGFPADAAQLPGPKLDRAALKHMASDAISDIFGPLFRKQDGYAKQVRLPEPPLLLTDRVLGISGEPGSMGKATIWTETDITADAWYLNEGHMPAGIAVEAGQSDLLAISWLGIDFHNRGERVYRLLGCDLSYHGSLPAVGDTLRYVITVDGHAKVGEVRLFFFHYDCFVNGERRMSVRNGQAGFFTDEELADSGGVLWEAETAEHSDDGPLDPPAADCTRHRFSADQVRAFAEGRPLECFGPGWELTQTHTRTPKIQSGRMQLIDEVEAFEPRGGAWKRGYLRVKNQLSSDDWYLKGHFKNDPCMPGTLMAEACLQCMVFFLTGMGVTVRRDGWRFDPVPGDLYHLLCRGQVIPTSRELTYEIFVEAFVAGPIPTLYADILATADGLKVFHGRRMGVRLVPDWPMTSMPELLADHVEPKPVAKEGNFPFDYKSLLSCAWGRPSEAFGQMAAPFDGTRHIARLPGPPYHFMSRVTRVEGAMGSMKTGASIDLEYDIPPDAWYFAENGTPLMPFAVLLEAALQPCGWLAVYIGCPGSSAKDVYFRNLDGTGTIHTVLPPDAGTLRTRTTLRSISKVSDIIIVSFDVACHVGQTPVYTLDTAFGFFPAEALANQVGLPADETMLASLAETSDFAVDLRERPPRYCDSALRLPGPMLLMLDRVNGYWPQGGKAGLGRLRGEKDVDMAEWFFKAHFFQDPVQPGSLGLEAMVQLLQFYMIHEDLGRGIENPRFQPLAVDRPFTWKYRGQVTPEKQKVTAEVEVIERGLDGLGAYAVADSSLWVDGLRIYHTPNLTVRIVPGEPEDPAQKDPAIPAPETPGTSESDPAETPGTSESDPAETPGTSQQFEIKQEFHAEEVLDPDVDEWLADHCPNWTLPTLPLMSMVDRLAAMAAARVPGFDVVGAEDVKVTGWLVFDGPRKLRTRLAALERDDETVRVRAVLEVWRDADRAELSRFEPVAEGTVLLARAFPTPAEPLAALGRAEPVETPYDLGMLFHGPAFQILRRLVVGRDGSTALLDAGGGDVPFGQLNQVLLDGAVHGIVHDELERWSDSVPRKHIAYPYRLLSAQFSGPAPASGQVRCETRFDGFDGNTRFPKFHIQLIGENDGRVWADLSLSEVMIPMGPHADDRQKRIDFREGRFVPGAGLSRREEDATRLTLAEVKSRDWLRGSVAAAYCTEQDSGDGFLRELAIKDHVSQWAEVHPATVEVASDGCWATCEAEPLTRFAVDVEQQDDAVTVRSAEPPSLDIEKLRSFGREALGIGAWPGEDLSLGLCHRFVDRVVLDDPLSFLVHAGRPMLFVGNHQVQIESMIFPMVAASLTGRHVVTIAKTEHRHGWIGPLSRFATDYPGVEQPPAIVYFDQRDPRSMFQILKQLKQEVTREGHSVFVHVEGQLGLNCRRPVTRLSSVFLDLARQLDVPLVPVRFAGGLPIQPMETTNDFPVGYGKQTYHIGRPIRPDRLADLPLVEQRDLVLDALNRLGPPLDQEQPAAPQSAFADRVARHQAELQLPQVQAVVLAVLDRWPDASPPCQTLRRGIAEGQIRFGDDDWGHWMTAAARWLLDRGDDDA